MATDSQVGDHSREQRPLSHLFTLRVWQEVTDPTETEWRGRLQHVPSGKVCYFRDWSVLVSDILSILSDDTEDLKEER
jgi:hypothetical protein